jgi:hypothetical protein
MMAEIGKQTGVATLFGLRIRGFVAWWLWRTYYLLNLPTTKKKLKVMGDWTSDLLFPPDVSMIKRSDTGDLSYPQKTKPTRMGAQTNRSSKNLVILGDYNCKSFGIIIHV